MRGAHALAACLCLALAVLPACGASGDGPGDHGSTVTVLYNSDERLFGPYMSMESWFLMFLPLAGHDESGNVVGRLARSWEYSPDARDWTFYLRSDVLWHDGEPVTAHDVKFSVELTGHPDVQFDDSWRDLDSIRVHDDTTLTMHYARPRDATGQNLWMVYWPRHLLEGLDPAEFYNWDFWTQPVGNGPYRYVRHVPQTMVELEANPDFYAGQPAIERVVVKFGGELGLPELLSGNVDILTWVNEADLPKLSDDPRFEVYHHMWPNVPWLLAILWNHTHPALGDARVRRALTHAIDRPEMLQLLNLPADLQIADVLFTGRQYRGGVLPQPLVYDTARAMSLLEQAGWIQPAGRQIRERDGQPLRFTAVLIAGGAQEQAAVYVQAVLRRIGVDMQIQALDFSVFMQRSQTGEFDAAFVPLFNYVDGHISTLTSEREGSIWVGGVPGYRNEEVVRLLASVKETADPAEIDSIYREIAPRFLEDLPITLLFPTVETAVVRKNIRGLQSPFRANPVQFMEHLWLEDLP